MGNSNWDGTVNYLVRVVMLGAFLVIFFSMPVSLRCFLITTFGKGVFDGNTPQSISPTIGEQLDSGRMKGMTHAEFVLNEFPDLNEYTSKAEFRAVLDANVPSEAREHILENARNRKRQRSSP